jgi:putative exporter of polyketide antibiotics
MLQNKRRRREESEASVRGRRCDSSEQLESNKSVRNGLVTVLSDNNYLPWWVGKLVYSSIFSGVIQRLEQTVEVEGHPF